MNLGVQDIVGALDAAISLDPATRQLATDHLKQWQEFPGFHYLLQQVYLDKGHPDQIRWQAAIYFKNSVNLHWRKTSASPISDDEKATLRQQLFASIFEDNARVNDQVALSLGRIARFDFPRDWPTLFQDIHSVTNSIDGADSIAATNSYKCLYYVIKSISQVQFGRAKGAMQGQLGVFLRDVTTIYRDIIVDWKSQSADRINLSVVLLKLLSKLLVDGTVHFNRDPDSQGLFNMLAEQYNVFLTALRTNSLEGDQKAFVQKNTKILAKMFNRLIEQHGAAFVLSPGSHIVIDVTLEMIQHAGSYNEEDEEFWEMSLVRGLILYDNLVKLRRGSITMKRRTEQDREEAKQTTETLNSVVFTDHLLATLAEKILLYCMRIRQKDLDLWNDDPEEFYLSERDLSWEFQLPACGAKVFEDLLTNFGDHMVPKLLMYLDQVFQDQNVNIIEADCALHALQMSTAPLYDHVDFDAVFAQKLAPLAQLEGDQMFKILGRRVCLVLSEWVSVKCSQENRVLGYQMLLHLLNQQDLVVQLEAVQCLRYIIDEYQFEPERLLPYLDTFLKHIFRLWSSLSNIAVKSELLKVLLVTVEQLAEHVKPYSSPIFELLEQSWVEESLRGDILHILTTLTSLSGEEGLQRSLNVLGAVLENRGKIADVENIYEDAVELWVAVVNAVPHDRNSPYLESATKLCTYLPDAIANATEALEDLLQIVDNYFELDCEYVLSAQHSSFNALYRTLAGYLPQLRSSMISLVCKSIATMAKNLNSGQTQLLESVLNDTGMMDALYNLVLDSDTNAVVQLKVLAILARMLFNNHPLAWNYISPQLVDRWIERFDNIGMPLDQKIHAIGITMALFGADKVPSDGLVSAVVEIWRCTRGTEGEQEPTDDPTDPMLKVPIREYISKATMSGKLKASDVSDLL
uniref:ARAD1C17864p n=1 Tax=Blastobotrys adeninivorans TaxID=409370 RepID=A0A060T0S4_BLAAD